VLGNGNASTIQVGSLTGTAGYPPENVTINTTGNTTITGAVGTGIGALAITNSASGATFQAPVTADSITLNSTGGTIRFLDNLNTNTFTSIAGDYNVSLLGASNTITGEANVRHNGTFTIGSIVSSSTIFRNGLFDVNNVNNPISPSQVILSGALSSNTGAIRLGPTTLATNATIFQSGSGTAGSDYITINGITGNNHDLKLILGGDKTIVSAPALGLGNLELLVNSNQPGYRFEFQDTLTATNLTTVT